MHYFECILFLQTMIKVKFCIEKLENLFIDRAIRTDELLLVKTFIFSSPYVNHSVSFYSSSIKYVLC